MSNYVIDSGIFVKLVVQESDSHNAFIYITEIIKGTDYIIVPAIFTYELAAVLRKYNFPLQFIKDFVGYYCSSTYLIPIPIIK